MLLCSFQSGHVWRKSFYENLLKVRTVKNQISLGIVSIVLVMLRYSESEFQTNHAYWTFHAGYYHKNGVL